MNRRSFLKSLASTALVPFIPTIKLENHVIDKYDKAGQKRGLAKIVLMTDHIGLNNYPDYDSNYETISIISYFHHDIVPMPSSINIEKQRLSIESAKIITAPTGHITVQAKTKKEAKYIIEDTEDKIFIKLAQKTLEVNDQLIQVKTSKFFESIPTFFSQGYSTIERHDMIANQLMMHPQTFKEINNCALNKKPYNLIFDSNNEISSNHIGRIWTANVFVSDVIPKNLIMFVSPPEYFGVLPVRMPLYHVIKDIYVQEAGQAIMDIKSIAGIKLI